MNTLFNKVFAGCNMDLYINHPEFVLRILKANRECRLYFNKISVIPKWKTNPTDEPIEKLTVKKLREIHEKLWKNRIVFFDNQKTKEVQMKVNIEIAKICHQVNRDYCIDEQLVAPPKWDELPLKIQESIVSGVAQVIANPKITPTEIHQKWVDYKEAEGWKPGEVKDFKLKLHPNLVPFKDLPSLEKRKDVIFIRTVKREMKK